MTVNTGLQDSTHKRVVYVASSNREIKKLNTKSHSYKRKQVKKKAQQIARISKYQKLWLPLPPSSVRLASPPPKVGWLGAKTEAKAGLFCMKAQLQQ